MAHNHNRLHLQRDSIQERLDSVNRRLGHPAFLRQISSSRLPSQAASDTSASPLDPSSPTGRLARSPLHKAIDVDGVQDGDDFYSPLNLLTSDRDVDTTHCVQEIKRFQKQFHHAWVHFGRKMASERGYSTFHHEHSDLVLAVDFNFYGTRMVTASSDHKLKVWDKKDDNWSIVDSWRAHDAEIVDVKWNGPFIGDVVGSIGEDGQFRLWEEDVTEIPGSGRRFRLISRLQSETKVPFMSLDFKNILTETYAALITRDGFLSIYEPVDHDDLSQWKVMTQRYVCPTPSRQEETGFKVCFHKEKLPCWTMIQAGLERNALSLAVAAMNVVKILRTDQNRNFYQAVELTGARNIIRDVAWANGSMRGFDIIATASKDGAVRIYELHPPEHKALPENTRPSTAAENSTQPEEKRNAPSGIGAGLAKPSSSLQRTREDDKNPGLVKNVVKKVAELHAHQGAVWRVAFSQIGDLLVSTGDDGVVRTWKKSLHNDWLEYAQIDVEESEA